MQDRLATVRRDQRVTVLAGSVVLLAALFSILAILPQLSRDFLTTADSFLLRNAVVVLVVAILLVVVLSVVVFVHPVGGKTLGGEDATPYFSNLTYLALLFTTGTAASVIFIGSSEVIMLYSSQLPPGAGVDPGTREAAVVALGFQFIHAGPLIWFTYLAIGLPATYFCYEYDQPFRVSSAVYPLVSDREWLADTIDLLAVTSILLLVAPSAGEVAQTFVAGIEFQWGVEFDSVLGVVMLVLAFGLVSITAAVTGLYRGARRLALVALAGFCLVGVVVFVLGPTRAILALGFDGMASQPAQLSTLAGMLPGEWTSAFTGFYWAAWLAWTPLLGVFIARISRGRTLREVVGYSVLATGSVSVTWNLLFGATAVRFQQLGRVDVVGTVEQAGPQFAVYPLFAEFPLSNGLLFVYLGLAILFLVTSLNVSVLVVATIASPGGNPTDWSRVFWGVLHVLVALVLVRGGIAFGRAIVTVVGMLTAVLGIVATLTILVALVPDHYLPSAPN